MGQSPAPQGAGGLTLTVDPDNVNTVRQAVAAAAQRCGADAERVSQATAEAVTTIVRNARDAVARGVVQVRAQRHGAELIVTVSDDGSGFAPDQGSLVGRVMAKLALLAESLSFSRTGTGADLEMRFPCAD